MKKFLVLMLVMVLALALCSCGGNGGINNEGANGGSGDGLVGQTMAGLTDSGNVGDTSDDGGDSDDGTLDEGTSNGQGSSGDSSSGDGSGSALLPSTDYYCYDRFSGDAIAGNYIRVYSSNSSQVVFDYVTNAGTFTSLTAYIDGNGHAYMDLTDSLAIDITFYSSEIYVDELENMGAMAYVFK